MIITALQLLFARTIFYSFHSIVVEIVESVENLPRVLIFVIRPCEFSKQPVEKFGKD